MEGLPQPQRAVSEFAAHCLAERIRQGIESIAMTTSNRYVVVTSRNAGGPTQKQVEIGPHQTLRICQLEGAGRIVRFWMTVPIIGQRHVLKDSVLRIYWDGETSPSVETPLGDFFCATFGRPLPFVSARLVVAGGGYLCRFSMPFNNGAVLEIENQSARPLRNLFFQIGYYEEPARSESEPTLHAQFRRENPTQAGRPIEVATVIGRGWFAGLKLDIQNRSWWLRPPFKEIALPRGLGLGLLEGWETCTVDGGRPNSGTGAEDYFSGGFYFRGGPFCTPTHGCTARSFLTGRVSAYRFHVDDPIPFQQSFEMTLDHGLENNMEGDYSLVAYWYQQEPHRPFPTLSTSRQRRVDVLLANPLQWLVCLSMLAALFGIATFLALWGR